MHTFAYNRTSFVGSASSAGELEQPSESSQFHGANQNAAGREAVLFSTLIAGLNLICDAGGQWWLSSRRHLQLQGAKVTAVAYHRGSGVLLTAYSSGIFDLHQMPAFTHLQVLSATRNSITAATFHGTNHTQAFVRLDELHATCIAVRGSQAVPCDRCWQMDRRRSC